MSRIRSSVLTASLRQNADGAFLIITRSRKRALFVSDSLSRQYPSLLTHTPKRKSITLRSRLRAGRVADGKYTPQKNARTQSNMTTAESIARCHRIYVGTCATGTCLFFCFLGGRLRTFLRAFRLRNGRREVSPPRILAPRQVYKSEAWRLYLILSRTQRRTHQTRLRQCRKNSGRSQPPSGKGLSEYLLQSAKGAGSRTLFPCKLPTRRKITPRPLPCYNTDTEGRRTHKTFDRKTAAPVFRTDEP